MMNSEAGIPLHEALRQSLPPVTRSVSEGHKSKVIPSLAHASGYPKNHYQKILAEMTNDTHMIRAGRVHVTDRCVHVGSGAKAQRQPHVELVRDAGGIRSIRVTCRCGEVLCLDLDYASKAA